MQGCPALWPERILFHHTFPDLFLLVTPFASPRPSHVAASSAGGAPTVYTQLRDDIVRGRLTPGAKLTEVNVARRCGVSRTPAREAIRRLLADGLLVPAGGGGRPRAAVAPLSSEAAIELYTAAGALEGIAARGIAALPASARTALAAALRSADAGFRRALDARRLDFDRLFARHDDFHRRLMETCAGPRIRGLLRAVRIQLDRYEWVYAPLIAPDFTATFAEHRAIGRAVRSGTADAIEKAVRANWLNGGARIGRAIRDPSAGTLAYGVRFGEGRAASSANRRARKRRSTSF